MVHAGKPFPPNVLHPIENADIDFSEGFTCGSRRWNKGQYIPYLHFFERLVRVVLLKFLDRNHVPHSQIAKLAYEKWKDRGEPIGDDWTDWFMAEDELLSARD